MANDKYKNNRNLWRKVYPKKKRKPSIITMYDPVLSSSITYDLQSVVRNRGFSIGGNAPDLLDSKPVAPPPTEAYALLQPDKKLDYRAVDGSLGIPLSPRTFAVLVEFDTLSSGTYLSSCASGGLSTGWCFRSNGTALTVVIGNGGLRQTAAYDMTGWGGDGLIHGVVGTYSGHDGAGELKLYVDKVLISTVNYTGYTIPILEDFVIGGHQQTDVFSGYSFLGKIYGFASCDTVNELADIEQWFDNCKTAADVVEFPSGVSEIWSVRQSAVEIPESWDEVGGTGVTVTKNENAGVYILHTNTLLGYGWDE